MVCKLATLTALCLGCSHFAGANVIGPGQNGAPDAFAPDALQLVESSGVLTSTNPLSGAVQGTVNYTVAVYLNLDPSCPNCLDFAYSFTNSVAGVNQRLSASGFAGVMTDVGYNTTSSGEPPSSVDRSAGAGDVIGFNFTDGDGLPAGSSTAMLLIETDATTYYPGAFTIQNGDESVTGVGYAPTMTTTPEPASLVLLGTGLLGIASAARRRLPM